MTLTERKIPIASTMTTPATACRRGKNSLRSPMKLTLEHCSITHELSVHWKWKTNPNCPPRHTHRNFEPLGTANPLCLDFILDLGWGGVGWGGKVCGDRSLKLLSGRNMVFLLFIVSLKQTRGNLSMWVHSNVLLSNIVSSSRVCPVTSVATSVTILNERINSKSRLQKTWQPTSVSGGRIVSTTKMLMWNICLSSFAFRMSLMQINYHFGIILSTLAQLQWSLGRNEKENLFSQDSE